MVEKFTFVDLFAGIGGFHYGLSKIGGKCILACEIDESASETYKYNYGITPFPDINQLNTRDIPEVDLLCAGFPCQSFSNVGNKKGLTDSRGALIYQVFRILNECKPKAFILENVKGLLTHDKGKTITLILNELESCGYNVKYKVLEAKDYGVPQLRKRVFIIGVRNDIDKQFIFPEPIGSELTLGAVLGGKVERDFAFTIRIGGRRSGIDNKYNWDCYNVDGKARYISIEECLQLQGFPRCFYLAGNKVKQFKQVGNAVPTVMAEAIGNQLIKLEII